jgi:nitrate reductase alpha subunit
MHIGIARIVTYMLIFKPRPCWGGNNFSRLCLHISKTNFFIFLPKIETDIDATEVILSLAPETNGQVAVKAWAALGKITGKVQQFFYSDLQ